MTRRQFATALLYLLIVVRTNSFSIEQQTTKVGPLTSMRIKGGAKQNSSAPFLPGLRTSTTDQNQDDCPIKEQEAPFFLAIFGLSATSPIFPAITALLAVARPIPFSDRFFSIVYPLYLCLANRYRFNRNAPSVAAGKKELPLLREGSGPWFFNYVKAFGLVGILLPLLVQFIAPRSIAEAAAPHLYLTLCQCSMEGLSRGPRFYALTRLMIPIGFNAYRIGSLWMWLLTAWKSSVAAKHTFPGGSRIVTWEAMGLTLAFFNMVMWTYNLFVFLMLRTVPQYLDRNKFPDSAISWKGQVLPVLDQMEDMNTIQENEGGV
jgi:hypothetical protein